MKHARSVVLQQDEFIKRRAQIIWVLEDGPSFEFPTLEQCTDVMETLEAEEGWCVGDHETEPVANAFDDSPLANAMGFQMFVPTSTMEVAYSSSQGGGTGQDNPTVEELLVELDALLETLD